MDIQELWERTQGRLEMETKKKQISWGMKPKEEEQKR